jgi:hypothetical protein
MCSGDSRVAWVAQRGQQATTAVSLSIFASGGADIACTCGWDCGGDPAVKCACAARIAHKVVRTMLLARVHPSHTTRPYFSRLTCTFVSNISTTNTFGHFFSSWLHRTRCVARNTGAPAASTVVFFIFFFFALHCSALDQNLAKVVVGWWWWSQQ